MSTLNEAEILSVIRLHEKGLSLSEISQQVDLSLGAVRRILGVRRCIANDKRIKV